MDRIEQALIEAGIPVAAVWAFIGVLGLLRPERLNELATLIILMRNAER